MPELRRYLLSPTINLKCNMHGGCARVRTQGSNNSERMNRPTAHSGDVVVFRKHFDFNQFLQSQVRHIFGVQKVLVVPRGAPQASTKLICGRSRCQCAVTSDSVAPGVY